MTAPADRRTERGDDNVVTVFGLGEAGSRFAADLAKAGLTVLGFDPAPVPTPAGVTRFESPVDAVAGSGVVLALTAAADAPTALQQALDSIGAGTIYADLSTARPALKRELAAVAGGRGLEFVDVALVATVPGRGVRTPSLASGPGASRYGVWIGRFEARCDVVGIEPGLAATRKLLRSVYMKGLAGVVIEAMRGAHAAGLDDWLWDDLVDEITAAGAPLLSRLVRGTETHALRRLDEMEASAQLLADLGVAPIMTTATVASLRSVIERGIPSVPDVPDE